MTTTNTNILTINAGSSSLKACLFSDGGATRKDFRYVSVQNIRDAFESLLKDLGDVVPTIIAHRFVHGGDIPEMARIITLEEITRLKGITHLAPLHMPANILGYEICEALFNCKQVACFDTAFHMTMPEISSRLPIPVELNFKRYGFHGLNYAHVANRLADVIGDAAYGNVVVAHLGSGSSLCLMNNLQSIDTSMGYTPAGGITMGTRCGDIDPGILIEMSKTMSPDTVSNIIFKQSGLLALSNGKSGNMHELCSLWTPDADFAIEYFCRSVAGGIGSLAAKVGGIDALVFTGGIGENSSYIRDIISDKLAFMNIKQIVVIRADEEQVIYKLAKQLT